MLVYVCDRCGRFHATTDNMEQIVSYDGKRMLLVCRDDRQCRRVKNVRSHNHISVADAGRCNG